MVAKVWYLVGIDLIDASKTSAKGNRYLLTQTDYFSKYVEAIPLPDKSALSVAKGLYKTYCRHGAPAQIISDQGREFVNQVRYGLKPMLLLRPYVHGNRMIWASVYMRRVAFVPLGSS